MNIAPNWMKGRRMAGLFLLVMIVIAIIAFIGWGMGGGGK